MPTLTPISLGCGFDCGKDKSVLFFGAYYPNGQMKCVGSKSIKMAPAELKKAVSWIIAKRAKVDPTGKLPFQIILESTSRYHERFLHLLHEAQLPACLVKTRQLKKYILSLDWNGKTDALDAKGMAHYGCVRKARVWQPYSENTLVLRDALRARKSLVKRKTQFSNQLHALSYAKFTSKEVERTYRRLLKQLLKEIEKLEKHIKALYEKDEKLRQKVDPIADSVPGLGWLTVLTVAVETNGFTSVEGRKQLAKYAGYDIVENQSGNFKGKTRISKSGNKFIRVAMYMAAVSHARVGEGVIVDAFNRARTRKPELYKHANVVVQRKLLLLIYTLWKTEAEYDPYHGVKKGEPKAFSSSTTRKNAPELGSEAHGIAASEEALPI